MHDHLMRFSFAVATFRLLSARLPGPGRCDPAGFSDPFGPSPGMAMTANRVPFETSSSKATTSLSTRIILAVLSTRIIIAVPGRLFVHRRTQHTWHVAVRRPARSHRAFCAADWPTLMDILMGTPSSVVYNDDFHWLKKKKKTCDWSTLMDGHVRP